MGHRQNLKSVYACVLLALSSMTATANPLDPTVVSGQASFSSSGNTLTVTNTPGAIINWQGFSIGANETTRFAQQSALSAVLNRVVSNNPSSILGSLQSNGRVFLINPNGIVFGAGSVVDVAGLVASTLKLSDADFLAGRNHFTEVPGAQNISNAGNISAQSGGQIFLIAPNVENTGVITAPNGEILLAAGYSVDLVSTSNPNLRVNITAPAGDATNVGQLIASSGSLGLFGAVVRNSGTVSADSAALQGGKIVFMASQRAEISGTVTANGSTGGTIEVLGNQVGIMDGATISANGTQGGGTVLIGGDAHGANPDVPNAQITYVAPTATISADGGVLLPSPAGGITSDLAGAVFQPSQMASSSIRGVGGEGNGGKVVVWADNATQFNGNIFARGGAVSGNGGWVEVSGKKSLGYAGLVNTTAAHGITGSLLLDPADITISTSANTGTMFWNAGTFTFSDIATGGVNASNLNVAVLVTQLGSTNVTVSSASTGTAAGNITVQTPIAWASANSLTLNAAGTGAIVTNAGSTITNTGTGGLTMQTASGSITLNAGVTLANGTFTANAVGANSTIAINAPVSTGTGAINLTAGSTITEGVGGSLSTVTDLATGTLGKVATSSVGGTTLNGANSIAIFSATNTTSGNLSLINTAPLTPYAGLTLLSTTNSGGGSISVNNVGIICVCWNGVTPTSITNNNGGAINLTATGASGWIRENTATITTTGVLTTSSSQVGNSTTLNGGTNMVGAFNATAAGNGFIWLVNGTALNVTGISTAGDASITNTAAVTINGPVTGSNSVSIAGVGITNNSTIKGNLGVSLNAGTGTLANATATSIITNGGGASTGAISLTADKMVLTSAAAGNGTVTAGAAAVSLNNSTLTDAINLGSTTDAANLTLELSSAELATISTTGLLSIGNASNSGAITVSAPMNLTSNTALANGAGGIAIGGATTATGAISLASSGAISQTATISTPGLLTTSSVGGTTLNGANTVGSFNAANSTSGAIALTNTALNLTLSGINQTGGGAVTVNNTGIITSTGAINSNGSVTLNSTGDVNVNATINNTATGLTSAQNAININASGKLLFTINNGLGASASSGSIVLSGATGVELDNSDLGNVAYKALAGNVSISSANGSVLALGGANITGQNITLSSAPTGIVDIYGYAGGNITASGTATINTGGSLTNNAAFTLNHLAAVSANSLNITAAGSVSLNTTTANLVTSNTGVGGTTINNTGALASVAMNDSQGNIVLNNTGAIGIAGTIAAAAGGAINLTALGATGSIIESGPGRINTTGLLTTSSVTGQTLNGANTVGSFNATNTTSGNIALTNTAATLTISGISQAGGGSVTVSNTGAIGIAGTIAAAAGGAINLMALGTTGSIIESGSGRINTTGLLTTSSVAGQTLNGANTVGSFNATNTTSGVISLTNTALNLALSGISQTGGGAVTLVTNGNMTLNAGSTIKAAAAPVTLSATGGNFANNSGTVAPITTTGLIKIYSTRPASDVLNGMVSNYLLYNCTYAGGCPAGTVIPAGQVGFYYSTNPNSSASASTTVINEIVNTTLLLAISSEENKAIQEIIAMTDVKPLNDTTGQPLPMCN